MFDETETIDGNPKSWAAWKREAERLQKIIDEMTTNNHPAHGPVSLERLHQISEILSKASAQSDGGNLGYAMVDAVKVIDGAIAARNAEPQRNPVLAYADSYRDMAKRGVESIPVWSVITDLERNIAPLYTAPPAPVVPEPKSYMDFWEQYPDMTAQESIERSAGWNACRAAMLQGAEPVSQDKLAFDNQVLSDLYHAQEKRLFKIAQRIKGPAFDKYAYSPSQAIDVLEAAIFGDSEVDHASMIAAAPQQEVKNV